MKITNSWTVPQTVDGPETLKHFEMIWLQHIMMILIGHLRWSSRMILCRTENIQQLWRHIKDLRRWNYISSVLQRMEKQLISWSWARARDSRFRKISFSAGLVENHQKMDIIISFLQSMAIHMTSFTMVRFSKTMVLLLGMFAVMQHCNCLRRMLGKTCYWKKPLVQLRSFVSMIARWHATSASNCIENYKHHGDNWCTK